MKKLKRMFTGVLCLVMVLTSCLSVSAAAIQTNENVQPRFNVGDPRDIMKFYYLEVNPIAEDIATGKRSILYDYKFSALPPEGHTAQGPWLRGSYTVEQTQKMVQEVAAKGKKIVGFTGSVKYKLEFSLPISWSYAINNSPMITKSIPQPHYPSTTYIYNFTTTDVPDNFMNSTNLYHLSFHGTVNYFTKSEVCEFDCYLVFNSPTSA